MKVLLRKILVMLLLFILFSCSQEKSWDKLFADSDKLAQQGKYTEAVEMAEKALKVAERSFGPEDPKVLISLDRLAILNFRQGKYIDAEQFYKREISILEKTGGPESPVLAIILFGLATTYEEQGKYFEAELVYKRRLAIWKKKQGPQYPSVASVLEEMAKFYNKAGKIEEARRCEARAKSIRARAAIKEQDNPKDKGDR